MEVLPQGTTDEVQITRSAPVDPVEPKLETDGAMDGLKRAKEFFGVKPQELVDVLVDAFDGYIYDACDALGNSLQREFPRYDASKDLESLRRTMQTSADLNFDKLELYLLRNILNVPSGVLPEKPVELTHASEEQIAEESVLDEQIGALKAEIEKLRVTEASLRKRTIQLDRTLARFQEVEGPIKTFTRSDNKPFALPTLIDLAKELKLAVKQCENQMLVNTFSKTKLPGVDETSSCTVHFGVKAVHDLYYLDSLLPTDLEHQAESALEVCE